MLRAADVRVSFGVTPALRGARLSVARGEILAVMGPSGSGKSTLLHCLAGIVTPDAGEIWFDGQRLDALSDAQRTRLRRTAFGFVFQFGQLVPELSAAAGRATVVAGGVAWGVAVLTIGKLAPRGTPVPVPGATYFVLMGTGLAVSLAVIGATLPLLGAMTGPATARFE